MEGSLYEAMLQQQSWLNMLSSDNEVEDREPEDDHDSSEGPRGREHGRGHCGGRRHHGRQHGGGRGFGGRGCHGFGPPAFMQFFMGDGPLPHCTPRGPPHGYGLPASPGPSPPFGPPPPPRGPPPFGPPHCPPHGPSHGGPPHGSPHGGRGRCGPVPRVDVFEEKTQYVLLANVPGFSKKSNIDITVADEKLTLKGKLPEAANNGEDVHPLLRERRPLHAFDRSFALPKDVDIAKITAKLEHGILRVVLLRKESKEPQPVPIGGGDSDKEDFVDVEDDRAAA